MFTRTSQFIKRCPPTSNVLRRHQIMRMSSTQTKPTPQFAEGVDANSATEEVAKLLDSKWKLTDDSMGLSRTYKFKNFPKAMDFWNVVAIRCKRENHHPEWSNLYNIVRITWTSHSPRGLSQKDISMAQFCDKEAVELGEVEYKPGDKCGCTTA